MPEAQFIEPNAEVGSRVYAGKKCEAKFDPKNPTAPVRELRCELGRGHNSWHENATTMWSNDDAGKRARW